MIFFFVNLMIEGYMRIFLQLYEKLSKKKLKTCLLNFGGASCHFYFRCTRKRHSWYILTSFDLQIYQILITIKSLKLIDCNPLQLRASCFIQFLILKAFFENFGTQVIHKQFFCSKNIFRDDKVKLWCCVALLTL